MIRPEAFEAQVEDTIRAIRRAEAAEAERDALKARVEELEGERDEHRHFCQRAEARERALREEMDRLRPEVRAFAWLMEQRLRANDHKGGWQDEGEEWLLSRLRDETRELAVEMRRRTVSIEAVGHEAADVANFAMMIADAWRAFALPTQPAEGGE